MWSKSIELFDPVEALQNSDEIQKTHYNPVAEAYGILVRAYQDPESTTADFTIAIDRALGFLGEALAE